jgi:hypothetical protein
VKGHLGGSSRFVKPPLKNFLHAERASTCRMCDHAAMQRANGHEWAGSDQGICSEIVSYDGFGDVASLIADRTFAVLPEHIVKGFSH